MKALKIFLVVIALLVLVVGLLVYSAVKHYFIGYDMTWNQEVIVEAMTPAGPVEASSVQRMDVQYFPDGMALAGTERSYDLVGEAVVLNLGEGRYLFVLPGEKEMAERAFWDLMEPKYDRGKLLRALSRSQHLAPRSVPKRFWPMMVTFEDVTRPATVSEVDPDDLAASFGEGYAILDVKIAITREAMTDGPVEAVLPWWRSRYETAEVLSGGMRGLYRHTDPLAERMTAGAFKGVRIER